MELSWLVALVTPLIFAQPGGPGNLPSSEVSGVRCNELLAAAESPFQRDDSVSVYGISGLDSVGLGSAGLGRVVLRGLLTFTGPISSRA